MNWIMYGFGFTSGALALAIVQEVIFQHRRKEEMKRREGMHEAFKSFIQSMEEHNESQEPKEGMH